MIHFHLVIFALNNVFVSGVRVWWE